MGKRAKKPGITNKLVFVNIAIFVTLSILVNLVNLPEGFIIENFGFSGDNIYEGKWWTIFTSIFLHGDIAHIALNSVALFFFGNALEKKVSPSRYALIYLAGGIIGEFASMSFYSPSIPLIGASGSIFALMGAAMVLNPFEIIAIPIPPYIVPVVYGVIVLSLFNVVSLLAPIESNVSYIAHIGGLTVGILLVLKEKKSKTGLIIALGVLVFTLMAPLIISNFLPAQYAALIGSNVR